MEDLVGVDDADDLVVEEAFVVEDGLDDVLVFFVVVDVGLVVFVVVVVVVVLRFEVTATFFVEVLVATVRVTEVVVHLVE